MDIRLATRALEAAGFTVDYQTSSDGRIEKIHGHRQAECISATRSGGTVSICVHTFENSDTAIDAGTSLGMESTSRLNFVVGNVVVEIDAAPGAEGEGQQAFDALRSAGRAAE